MAQAEVYEKTAAKCKQLKPLVEQEVYDCRGGALMVKKQTLWQCKLAGRTWVEWRDDGPWQKTGESC